LCIEEVPQVEFEETFINMIDIIISTFRFFSDIQNISCDPVGDVSGHQANCSDRDPTELPSKEQDFNEAAEIIIDRTETSTTKTMNSNFN
jgi:hypothetical protein